MKDREFLKDYLENASTTELIATVLLICLISKNPEEIETLLEKDIPQPLTCNCQGGDYG